MEERRPAARGVASPVLNPGERKTETSPGLVLPRLQNVSGMSCKRGLEPVFETSAE